MDDENNVLTPLTSARLHAEVNGPVWQQFAELSQVPKLPGIYAHTTRGAGYVLYIGRGIGAGGLHRRLGDEFRLVRKALETENVAARRDKWAPVIAGLAEHDLVTWFAETETVEAAIGWELYFQGLSWHLMRKLLPLSGWSYKSDRKGDWVTDLIDSERRASNGT